MECKITPRRPTRCFDGVHLRTEFLLMTHLGSEPIERDLDAPTPPLMASFPIHDVVPARPLNPLLGLPPPKA